MVKVARGDVLLRFAALSLLAVGVVGLILAWIGGLLIEGEIRGASAEAVARSVRPQVEARLKNVDLGQPLSGPALEQFHAFVASSLLSQETSLIRIRNAQGQILYSSRSGDTGDVGVAEAELKRAFVGETSATVGSVAVQPGVEADGEEAFVVFVPLTPVQSGPIVAVLEAQQGYREIAAAIAGARKELYLGLGVALAGFYLVLQVVALAATAAFSRAYARLSYLYRTGQRIRASLDVSEVLSQVARDATILGRGQYGLAVVQGGDDGDFIVKAGYDHKLGAITQHHRKMDEWFLHRVTASKESLATTGAAEPYCSLFDYASVNEEIGLLGVPLSLPDRVIGVIIVVRVNRPFAFAAREINMVEELAEQAALAIEQANLLTRVRSYASELELSYDSTLKALMAALDTKDAVTEGHSERVAHLTVAVARELGIPEEQLTDVERGALLHDVGKIGVPDSVLRKPQALSRKEWQAMQKHPLLSGILVSKVGVLEGALPILLYHHERYDGQGYPFGLLGDKIPLEARIFAVVDAYDAMTSDRPYRVAMPHEQALAEIIANAGTQFDPVVAEAFTAVLERMHAAQEGTKEAA